MFLKSPYDYPIQVCLLTSHAIVIPPEGREVDQRFLTEAFKLGCIPGDMQAEDVDTTFENNQEKSRDELIVEGLKKMLEDGCELDGTGRPSRDELSTRIGFNVGKVAFGKAWLQVEQEAQQ